MDSGHPWILLRKPRILDLHSNPTIANVNLEFTPFMNFVAQTSDSKLYLTDYSLHILALHA